MTYTLYDYLPSGNGYKVRLVCKRLNIPYRLVQLDIKKGATRTADFLAKNPNGRIPLLEVPGKGFLPESHAIITFLAEGSDLIPADAWERAQKTTLGYEALTVLERGLTGKRFLVADRFTLADIALFAYTHVAEEGKFSLAEFPAIRSWISRVQAEPKHAPITAA